MTDFLTRQAAAAGEQLAREMWAVLVSFPFDLQIWVLGCPEARVLVEPDGRAVFQVTELARVLERAPSPSAFRVICGAKRAFSCRVERVREDEDDPATLSLFSTPIGRPAQVDPGTPVHPPSPAASKKPDQPPREPAVLPGLGGLIDRVRRERD